MYEINLVPEIKGQMIKTQKKRNLVLFICIMISIASAVLILIFLGIKAGQDIAIKNQDSQMEMMSKKVKEYDGLGEVLTMQYQLNQLGNINENKTMLSRVFNVFSVLLPTGADKITLSKLNIDVANGTLSFDAQADAGEAPFIDYRVLESFKKGVAMMKYDYGRYVDAEGNQIPTMCIVEADALGNAFMENGSIYAKWAKNVKGCNPADDEQEEKAEDEEDEENEDEVVIEDELAEAPTNATVADAIASGDYEIIWRTPQITDKGEDKGWYSAGFMDLNGDISGIEHFESECTSYTGEKVGSKIQWNPTNECYLAADGFKVASSSNGKDAAGNLVLRFSGSMVLDSEVFKFRNKHMIAIAPTGRQNVTDSYAQINGMFKEPASDCLAGDLTCDNTANEKGEE